MYVSYLESEIEDLTPETFSRVEKDERLMARLNVIRQAIYEIMGERAKVMAESMEIELEGTLDGIHFGDVKKLFSAIEALLKNAQMDLGIQFYSAFLEILQDFDGKIRVPEFTSEQRSISMDYKKERTPVKTFQDVGK